MEFVMFLRNAPLFYRLQTELHVELVSLLAINIVRFDFAKWLVINSEEKLSPRKSLSLYCLRVLHFIIHGDVVKVKSF
jgi:hypothetical protein